MKIALNMIVKDESPVIRRCLASVKPLIDYWVIVDTGSTDGTQQIIRDFMKDLPGELHESPWVNFGHNRNEALDLARGKGDYHLFIDADDRLVYAEGFSMPPLTKDRYHVIQEIHGHAKHETLLMIKDLPDYRWTGVLHEHIASATPKSYALLEGIVSEYLHDGHRSQDPGTAKKDASMLEEALRKDPSDSRNVFYLGQSYRGAGDLVAALQCYERRGSMGGAENEVFHSLYFIGLLQSELKFSPDAFIKSYCKAYLYRPSRVEPLFQAIHHFIAAENYFLGYLLSRLALSVPLPVSCDLVVEPWVYDWCIAYLLYTCAKKIGKNREAYETLQKLLANHNLPPAHREQLRNDKKNICEKLRHA